MIHTTDSKMERLAYSGDTNKQPILKKKLAQTWGYTTLTPTFWRQREVGRCLVYIASCRKARSTERPWLKTKQQKKKFYIT